MRVNVEIQVSIEGEIALTLRGGRMRCLPLPAIIVAARSWAPPSCQRPVLGELEARQS